MATPARPDGPAALGWRGAAVDRALVGAVALAVAGVLLVAVAVPIFLRGAGWGYDFTAYFVAATRTRDGLSPYLPVNLAGPFTHGPQWYVYAPVLSTLLIPLTALGLQAASLVWMGLTFLFTALACALLPVRPSVRLAALGVSLLSLGFLTNLNLGSVNALLLCSLVLAWRRPAGPASGLALALSLSVRPYLATVLVGRALWHRWSAIAWTAIGGLILVTGTALVAGPGSLVDFVRLLSNVRFGGAPHNGALGGVLEAAGAPGPVVLMATAAVLLVALGAILVARRQGDEDVTFAVGVGASILASPVIWDHYLILLVIPAALLAQRGRTWGLVLPLLAWLPWQLYPLVALAGTLAPFAGRRPSPAGS
ncbi:MAG: glycosyltransferase family 87 protein [Candidatus Limnocylindrales bacterium]